MNPPSAGRVSTKIQRPASDFRAGLVSTGEARREEVFDVVADVSRARQELGWEPRVGLAEGLLETVRWTETQLAITR